jgi:hypothetical protein
VGLVMRLKLEESDDMKRVLAQKKTVKLPLKDVLRDHWGLVLLGAGTLPLIHVTYLKSNFALSWATKELGYSQGTFLGIIAIALVVQFLTQPLGAVMVSRMDMRRAIWLMILPEFLLMPVMFFAIQTKVVWIALLGMCLATIPHSMLSLAYQLCSLVVGGGTPVFAQWVLNATGSIVGVAVSSALYAVLSLACTLVLLNRTGYRADELSSAEQADAADLGQTRGDAPAGEPQPIGKTAAA